MKVLVAHDGGEAGDRALSAIATWALDSQAELHVMTILKPGDVHDTSRGDLVHVMTPAATTTGQLLNSGEPLPRLAENRSQAVDFALSSEKERLWQVTGRFLPGVNVTVHAEIDDHVAEGIIAWARKLDCTLIAVGTHGRTGITHALMGSVAEKVVRQSPLPVLVVGPKVEPGQQG